PTRRSSDLWDIVALIELEVLAPRPVDISCQSNLKITKLLVVTQLCIETTYIGFADIKDCRIVSAQRGWVQVAHATQDVFCMFVEPLKIKSKFAVQEKRFEPYTLS